MKKTLCAFLFVLILPMANAFAACATNEIDVLGDGTQCEATKFSVTTTNLAINNTIGFSLSAKGTFYVDCGDGGTLTQVASTTGSTISQKMITRTSTNNTNYRCTYFTAGTKTIRFGGVATAYSTDNYTAAISITQDGTQEKIVAIDGSLGAIFPVLSGAIPRFYNTFSSTQITSIPAGLFSAINTSSSTDTSRMFYGTFSNTQITSIPTGLFDSINTSSSTNTSYMFSSTFNSTQITSIPSDLFSTINTSSSTNTSNMFSGTFSGTQITSIPDGLFGTINTSSSTNTSNMFSGTFSGTQITSIPSGLFSGIDTSSSTDTSRMFYYTFNNCTSLNTIPTGLFSAINTSSATNTMLMFYNTFASTHIASIPSGLFSAINTSSSTNTTSMFKGTFSGTQITSIPAGLFSAINTSSATSTSYMFQSIFQGCTQLTGYIPSTTFPNTITPGSSSSNDMWKDAFSGTQLATTCPAGTTEYNSGFQNDWGYSNGNTTTSGTYRVSCEPCPTALPTGASWVSGTCNFTCENGYHTESFDLNSTIGTVAGGYDNNDKVGYISNDGNDTYNESTYGLIKNGTFALEYANDKGMIKGRAQCSSQVPANPWYEDANYTFTNDHFVSTLQDSTGQYCWCTLDEYAPVDGAPMSLSGPWVFGSVDGSASNCAGNCADYCAFTLGSAYSRDLAFRSAVLGSFTGGAATCAANEITINWSNASAADIDANEAGTVTYGGDIRTPRAATIIPGKVFLGWKFSAPEGEPDQ